MKFKDIKTEREFFDFADVWYQRTHNLRRVWQDESETEKRRLKAFVLFQKMAIRVSLLSRIATRFQHRTPKFDNGSKIEFKSL